MRKLKNTFTNLSSPKIIQRSIGDLIPDPNNARLHETRQINLLAKSIQAFGFNVPVLIDAESHVLAGHGRLLACQKLGIQEVPTISLAHLTPTQAKAFMLADNRLTEIAKWDDNLLAIQLKELSMVDLNFDLEATGFTIGQIDMYVEGLSEAVDPIDEEEPTILEGPATTQLGDIWLMGEHRLICANALEVKSFGLLMDGQVAGMVITDPPFNCPIDGYVSGKGKIKHRDFVMASGEMSSAEFTQFLQTTFDLLVAHSKNGSVHTIFMDWRSLPEILAAGKASYTSMLNLCVWVKNQAGQGSLYRSQHEFALIYKNGTAPHQNNVQLGRFGRYRTNVWNYGGIQAMRNTEEGNLLEAHPTVKNLQMIADAILDCSRPNDIILDPFLGSGTTLLACSRIGRHCYGMELDPLYVDTAVRRWQIMTGQDAIHAATGETFTQHLQKVQQVSQTKPRSLNKSSHKTSQKNAQTNPQKQDAEVRHG